MRRCLRPWMKTERESSTVYPLPCACCFGLGLTLPTRTATGTRRCMPLPVRALMVSLPGGEQGHEQLMGSEMKASGWKNKLVIWSWDSGKSLTKLAYGYHLWLHITELPLYEEPNITQTATITQTSHLSRLLCVNCSVGLTLCNPIDCSSSGFSVHGILRARILEWVAIPFSRGFSWPRGRTRASCIASRFYTVWATISRLAATFFLLAGCLPVVWKVR